MKTKIFLLALLLLVLVFSCAKSNPVSANNTTDNNIGSGIESNGENDNNGDNNNNGESDNNGDNNNNGENENNGENNKEENILFHPELIYGEYNSESYENHVGNDFFDPNESPFTIVNKPMTLTISEDSGSIYGFTIVYNFDGKNVYYSNLFKNYYENGFQILKGNGVTSAGGPGGGYYTILKFDSNFNLVEASFYTINKSGEIVCHTAHNMKKTPIK
ncbi:unnamed protein product [Brachyspira suanatina]|uniref:Lipoprotein n=1 Tax=Brachyspira suanatina TaxID=381802 RepID=A0A0G4K342_9SPIR|nr:hypothetical protein [Brachyspira suanatina]CRF31377.1 unnamed protein product [Brachyspira suanatina]